MNERAFVLSLRRLILAVGCVMVLGVTAVTAQGRCGSYGCQNVGRGCEHGMSPQAFNRLMVLVKEQSFSDTKMQVIEAASLGCVFTSAQCGALMSLLDFDDNKLGVLRLLAPHLVDYGEEAILSQLTFSSSKEKALNLLEGATLR